MLTITLAAVFLTALLVSYISIPSIIKVAEQKHLYDAPDARKLHITHVPTLGGIGIFAGFSVAVMLFLHEDHYLRFSAIAASLIILFFTGVKDDIIAMPPYKKMAAQLLAAGIVVIKGDTRLTSLYGILGIYDIPYWASCLVSLFTFIVIINSFNLIDGINGLAGGIGVIVASILGVWFYLQNEFALSVLAFGLCGALIGFLRFNLINARIFMGDTGSLIIGLVLAFLTIEFIEQNKYLPYFAGAKAPLFAVALLIIPLFDTLRVFIIRISQGQSPFSADRRHLHHVLLSLGCSHLSASLILYIINILFVVTALLLVHYPIFLLAGALLALLISLNLVLAIIKVKTKNQLKPLPQAFLKTH